MVLRRPTGVLALIILTGCEKEPVVEPVNPCIAQHGASRVELYLQPPIEVNPEAAGVTASAGIRRNRLFSINWDVCYEQQDVGPEPPDVTTAPFDMTIEVVAPGSSGPPIYREKRPRLVIILDQSTGVVEGNTRRACIPGLTIVPDGSPFTVAHQVTVTLADDNVTECTFGEQAPRPDTLTHDFVVIP